MRLTKLGVSVGALLLAQSCVTTTMSSRTWTEAEPAQPERHGRVEWIRETVTRTEGHPGAGAAAGAVIGGILGGLLSGRGAGAAVGAAGGAIVGANASSVQGEARTYDVSVRFDDGTTSVFAYRGRPPFRPGEDVVLTARGLMPEGVAVAQAGPPPIGSSDERARPSSSGGPASAPPPPPETARPDGQWVYTAQYGWVFMPYATSYTFTPDYEAGDPYMYVYRPVVGWAWVTAPWLWGWGPVPYFGPAGGVSFTWYGHGWGSRWEGGHRSARYRVGGAARTRPGRRRR